MYYNHNVKRLGEKTALVYANKYVNYLQLGSKYTDQEEVNKLCPETLREVKSVPDFFVNIIKNIN